VGGDSAGAKMRVAADPHRPALSSVKVPGLEQIVANPSPAGICRRGLDRS